VAQSPIPPELSILAPVFSGQVVGIPVDMEAFVWMDAAGQSDRQTSSARGYVAAADTAVETYRESRPATDICVLFFVRIPPAAS
jgi:hypothetical protein